MAWFKKNLSKILPQILATLFLVGFVVYAWTEPASPPPGGNVPAPINVGPQSQTKQGNLTLAGVLKVEGNLLDKLGRIIYNAATGKIDKARLPFEQGDITSDVDTNTFDSDYFNVANLIPGNIRKDMAFGRNSTGTAEVYQINDIGSIGLLQWTYVSGWLPGSGAACYSAQSLCNTPWLNWYGYANVPGFTWFSYDPKSLMNYQVTSVTTCYSLASPCPKITLNQSYTATCAPGWTKFSIAPAWFSPGTCSNGQVCDFARCVKQ